MKYFFFSIKYFIEFMKLCKSWNVYKNAYVNSLSCTFKYRAFIFFFFFHVSFFYRLSCHYTQFGSQDGSQVIASRIWRIQGPMSAATGARVAGKLFKVKYCSGSIKKAAEDDVNHRHLPSLLSTMWPNIERTSLLVCKFWQLFLLAKNYFWNELIQTL